MNQSIIFNDQLTIETNRVKFIAQQQGSNISCCACFSLISQLCDNQLVNAANVATLFELCRFDLEDKAERLIQQEAFNHDGEIMLTLSRNE
jgi:hypothetical protein